MLMFIFSDQSWNISLLERQNEKVPQKRFRQISIDNCQAGMIQI